MYFHIPTAELIIYKWTFTCIISNNMVMYMKVTPELNGNSVDPGDFLSIYGAEWPHSQSKIATFFS